jgi:hypothetical protein
MVPYENIALQERRARTLARSERGLLVVPGVQDSRSVRSGSDGRMGSAMSGLRRRMPRLQLSPEAVLFRQS